MENLIKKFASLSYADQSDLLNKLKLTLSTSKPILNHVKPSKACPHCASPKVYKHGAYKNGGTRYQCQACRKTFNELTGTSIHCVKKKELWDRFLQLMLESRSIKYISKELDLSTKTVFDWRHKVLGSFSELFTKEFKGVVETDTVFFRFSQKGRPKAKRVKAQKKERGTGNNQVGVLMTMDRYKTYDFKVVKMGKLDVESLKLAVNKERFNKENIVCSDGEAMFKNLFKEMGLKHKVLTALKKKRVMDGVYHINTLNGMISRNKKWIGANFSSVSTKYLNNYLNWFAMLEILKGKEGVSDKLWDYILMDGATFERNKLVEENYKELLEDAGLIEAA